MVNIILNQNINPDIGLLRIGSTTMIVNISSTGTVTLLDGMIGYRQLTLFVYTVVSIFHVLIVLRYSQFMWKIAYSIFARQEAGLLLVTSTLAKISIP